jgi:1-acyl-sn-glycerol-3-phosphate acyltransferase
MKKIDLDPNKTLRMYAYIFGIIPRIIARLGLNVSESARMLYLLARAYVRELRFKSVIAKESPRSPFMPSTRESYALVDFFMERLITSWDIRDEEYLEQALTFHESGGRVIIMSNHTGGVDAPVADYVFREYLSERYRMVWVAGKRVWESIFLRIFSRCVDLLTMYGMKYVQAAEGDKEKEAEIRIHNVAMLRWMKKHPDRVFLAFPQGTWCNKGYLTAGEPAAMSLIRVLGEKERGGTDVMVLPAFLSGPEKIIPPFDQQEGGDDEFYHFLDALTPHAVSYRFGPPLRGHDLVGLSNGDGIEHIMFAIADLAPTEAAKGPYACAKCRSAGS